RGSFLSVLRTYRSYETWLIVNKALFFRTYVPEPTIRLHSSWTVPTAVAVKVPSTKTLLEALEVPVPVPREVAVPGSVVPASNVSASVVAAQLATTTTLHAEVVAE